MNTSKIAALALFVFGALGGPAPAATVDYELSIPLVDIDATDPTPTSLLTGTLSYDESNMEGSGLFSLVGPFETILDIYSGFAAAMPLDNAVMGLIFDGYNSGGAELYLNIAANLGAETAYSGQVNYCLTVGCAMFNSVGATMTPAASLPGATLPGVGVSPVPLPSAVSLFGGALLALASFGAAQRLVPRLRAVVRS